MRFIYLLLCCLLAGCTSSSRLANPLGLDLDPGLRIIDGQRPVPVIYPARTSGPALADTYGRQWEIMSHGYLPYEYKD